MGLEFPVGHSRSLTVDDLEVGWWDGFGCFVGVIGGGIENKATTCFVPFLVLVPLFCLFVLDEVQLLVVETILVLGFFVGASDPSDEGLKNVGSVGRDSCWRSRGGGVDMLGVEVEAKGRKFPVVGFEGEASLGNCCLVDSHAPHHK